MSDNRPIGVGICPDRCTIYQRERKTMGIRKLPIEIDAEDTWEAAKDLGDELVEAGHDPDKTAKALAVFLDTLIPFDLVPGIGLLLEFHDGPILERIALALGQWLKVDPDVRAKRAKKRGERKAKRAKRRARRRG